MLFALSSAVAQDLLAACRPAAVGASFGCIESDYMWIVNASQPVILV